MYCVSKEIIIPGIENLPSIEEIKTKEIKKIKNFLYETLKNIGKQRAKADLKKEHKDDIIIFILGDYSDYPNLKGVDAHIYTNQPVKKIINVKDKNILIQENFPEIFANFEEMVEHFKVYDGGWPIHLDGTILGPGFMFETNLEIKFDDKRGMGSKAAKHQSNLEHVVCSLTLSGAVEKLVRKYKRTDKDPSSPYKPIKEIVYDPYKHI